MFKFTMYKFYIETTNKVSILITFPHIPQIEESEKRYFSSTHKILHPTGGGFKSYRSNIRFHFE